MNNYYIDILPDKKMKVICGRCGEEIKLSVRYGLENLRSKNPKVVVHSQCAKCRNHINIKDKKLLKYIFIYDYELYKKAF
jgi:thymidine kinase